jgi:hypothetical protein
MMLIARDCSGSPILNNCNGVVIAWWHLTSDRIFHFPQPCLWQECTSSTPGFFAHSGSLCISSVQKEEEKKINLSNLLIILIEKNSIKKSPTNWWIGKVIFRLPRARWCWDLGPYIRGIDTVRLSHTVLSHRCDRPGRSDSPKIR